MQDFDPPRGAFEHGYPYWRRMALKPLGHRVLIRPDEQPEQSEGGLVLPQDHDHVSFSGTVVAVGKGSAHDHAIRQATLRRALAIVDEAYTDGETQADLLAAIRADMETEIFKGAIASSEIGVGDRVAFSAESGAVFTEDGQQYLVMNEDDVVVLVEEGESAA